MHEEETNVDDTEATFDQQHLEGVTAVGPEGGIHTSSTGSRLPDGDDRERPFDPTAPEHAKGFNARNDETGQSERLPD